MSVALHKESTVPQSPKGQTKHVVIITYIPTGKLPPSQRDRASQLGKSPKSRDQPTPEAFPPGLEEERTGLEGNTAGLAPRWYQSVASLTWN